jgi:hypothetical protein
MQKKKKKKKPLIMSLGVAMTYIGHPFPLSLFVMIVRFCLTKLRDHAYLDVIFVWKLFPLANIISYSFFITIAHL